MTCKCCDSCQLKEVCEGAVVGIACGGWELESKESKSSLVKTFDSRHREVIISADGFVKGIK